MIPSNLKQSHILSALSEIDRFGVPEKRSATKYQLIYKNKSYPPKYVISLANKYANGEPLDSNNFSGGNESNSFLTGLGFQIIEKGSFSYTKLLNKSSSFNNSSMVPKILSVFKNDKNNFLEQNLKVATVTISSDSNHTYIDNPSTLLKEVIKGIAATKYKPDVILFPAGFYNTNNAAKDLYSSISEQTMNLLNSYSLDSIVCLGIDGRNDRDQVALAISNQGIIAAGRKFFPTDQEKGYITLSENFLSGEDGFSRIFEKWGKKLYLAVCYDGFGIRKLGLKNPGVDIVLDLAHGFFQKGEGGSGDVYFAKHGFAGSSKQWSCPTFGAAVFFQRNVPPQWPTGIIWNQGNMSTTRWKYEMNELSPSKETIISTKHETAYVRYFDIL